MRTDIKNPRDIVKEKSEFYSDSVREKALELIDNTEYWTRGYSPKSMAACAVYAAGILELEWMTQREIVDIFDVSETTIQKHYHAFFEAAAEDEILRAKEKGRLRQ